MAKRDYLFDIDLNKNQLLNLKLQNLATHPTLTINDAGFTYWNTADKLAYNWTGTAWIAGGTGTNLTNTPTPTGITINSSTGSGTVLPVADTINAGLLSKALYDRLMGTVLSNDYGAYSVLAKQAASMSAITLPVNSILGRIAGDIQAILIDSDLTTVSASDDTLATAKAIKTYIDSVVTGALVYQSGYDAAANSPMLDSTPITGITKGWTYTVTTNGTFFTEPVQVGDMIIAEVNSPTTLSDWTLVNKNIPDIVSASEGAQGIIAIATALEVAAAVDTSKAIVPSKLSSVSTLGTITTGTWHGTIIDPTYGGTGINNGAKTITVKGNLTLSGSSDTIINTTDTTNITLPTAGILTAKYATTISGNNVTTTFTITHGLKTLDIVASVLNASTLAKVEVSETITDLNTLTLNFNNAPLNGVAYRVIVVG